jgi:hypothetical protein
MSTFSDPRIYLLGLFLATGCGPAPPPAPIQGNTMGTVYTIRVASLPAGLSLAALARDIETELERVNAAMSTYREDSEISRFNRGPADTWLRVSPELEAVRPVRAPLISPSANWSEPGVSALRASARPRRARRPFKMRKARSRHQPCRCAWSRRPCSRNCRTWKLI